MLLRSTPATAAAPYRLNVLFTVDVEVWCDGWVDLDARFPAAFDDYVYGRTPGGEYGLRYQAELLRDHGLTGVFFVEPLFSGRFGAAPLAEIVGLLRERDQEVQLHLHTEWLDEWPTPLFDDSRGKTQYLFQLSADDQRRVVADGLARLTEAGADGVNCLRAGSFGFNADTLDAAAAAGLTFDSSYNATAYGPASGVAAGQILVEAHRDRGVVEVPMTVYDTRMSGLRHVQLGACSFAEIEQLLWAAAEERRQSFVLLSHNFELLAPSKRRADPVVVSRMRRLCELLDRHRDVFCTRGFRGFDPTPLAAQPAPLAGTAHRSAWRVGEQLWRRAYR